MLAFYMALIDEESDKEKFERIYHLYAKRMLKMAYSVLHNRSQCEDVVHEAFIKIARNIKAVDEVDSVKTLSYVLKATKNTAINWDKKHQKEKSTVKLDDCEKLSDDDFIERLDIGNTYNRVVEAILSLDEKYRDVLYYHFVCEMSVNSISDLLGRKTSTVKQQLVRSKKILLEKLREEQLL